MIIYAEGDVKLDLESIGSSLGFEGELIWAGLDWRGPDISLGLVMDGLNISGEKSYGWGGVVVCGL